MLSAQPSGYLFTYLKDESMSAFWKILDNLLHFYTKKKLKIQIRNAEGKNSGKICIKLLLLRYRLFCPPQTSQGESSASRRMG